MKKPSGSAGRPRGFDRDTAIERAMHVFWKQGYEGASLHDLTAAMGIQPASLYGAFGSKQGLFALALARYLAGPTAFLHAALQEPTAYAVAVRILREAAEFLGTRRGARGCMTIQAAMAGGEEAEPVRRRLIRLRVRQRNELRRRFERAKAERDLPEDTDPAGLADFITAVFQGMAVQAVNGAGRQRLLRIANTALRAWPR